MKTIRYIVTVALLVVVTGCDDSFLDMTNRFGSNTDTFYKTRADFDGAVGGVYYSLYISGGNVFGEEHITASLLSDIMLGMLITSSIRRTIPTRICGLRRITESSGQITSSKGSMKPTYRPILLTKKRRRPTKMRCWARCTSCGRFCCFARPSFSVVCL
jgi:hypothetical protein